MGREPGDGFSCQYAPCRAAEDADILSAVSFQQLAIYGRDILCGSGKLVLRRQSIVHGDDLDALGGGDRYGLDETAISGAEREGAAVEVDQNPAAIVGHNPLLGEYYMRVDAGDRSSRDGD